MECIRCHRQMPGDFLYCPFCGKRQSPVMKKPPAKRARRAPGSGNIHKLSGKRAKPFAARIGQRVIGTYASESEAVVALADFIARGRPLQAASATFAEVYEAWKALHYGGITAKTAKSYTDAYKRAEALHRRRMRDLRTADYQKIIDDMPYLFVKSSVALNLS